MKPCTFGELVSGERFVRNGVEYIKLNRTTRVHDEYVFNAVNVIGELNFYSREDLVEPLDPQEYAEDALDEKESGNSAEA